MLFIAEISEVRMYSYVIEADNYEAAFEKAARADAVSREDIRDECVTERIVESVRREDGV